MTNTEKMSAVLQEFGKQFEGEDCGFIIIRVVKKGGLVIDVDLSTNVVGKESVKDLLKFTRDKL